MNFIKTIVLCLLFFSLLNAKNVNSIVFAPLPTKLKSNIINDFNPLISYLEKNLNIEIEYKFYQNYKDIIDAIKNKEVDIAYLGPLPYIALYSEYKGVKPLVSFKEKNKKHNYRCVLAKFKTSNIDISKDVKIALTQPLSTCGYFMTNILLKKQYDKSLENFLYSYEMSHENSLLSLVKGTHILAGAKEDIAKKYESLGVSIIKRSILLPGFTLVVNKNTISDNLSSKIKKTLLNIDTKTLSTLKKGRYGFSLATQKDYGNLKVNINKIPFVGNINE